MRVVLNPFLFDYQMSHYHHALTVHPPLLQHHPPKHLFFPFDLSWIQKSQSEFSKPTKCRPDQLPEHNIHMYVHSQIHTWSFYITTVTVVQGEPGGRCRPTPGRPLRASCPAPPHARGAVLGCEPSSLLLFLLLLLLMLILLLISLLLRLLTLLLLLLQLDCLLLLLLLLLMSLLLPILITITSLCSSFSYLSVVSLTLSIYPSKYHYETVYWL